MVALSTSALAHDLVNISVEMDGWTMLPIADAGATTHIIATRDDDEALFTDVDVVLYEKTTTGWSGSAYDPSVTKEDAMVDLADEFGLADPFGGTWHIDLDEIDVLNYMIPRAAFGKGFFVDDPLYFIANMLENPDPLAVSAEGSGIAAGSGVINTGNISGGVGIGDPSPVDGCGCDACIQDAIASGADAFLNDPTMLVEDIDATISAYFESIPGGCCPETTTCGPISVGDWTCAPWVNTQWLRDGTCVWRRTVTRVQTINCVKKCSDCITLINFVQTRIETGEAVTTSFASSRNLCEDDGPFHNPCNAAGVDTLTTSNWSPEPPACP